MKKIMSMMLALTFITGAASMVFAQDTNKDTTKQTKKAKKGKKKSNKKDETK